MNLKLQEERNKPGSIWKNQIGDVVNEFTVYGRSKRGWTTWTIGAVDKRVKAMIPTALTFINMQKILRYPTLNSTKVWIKLNFSNWYQNMAAWSFALDPYYNENLTKYFDDPVLDKMTDIIVWGDALCCHYRPTMIAGLSLWKILIHIVIDWKVFQNLLLWQRGTNFSLLMTPMHGLMGWKKILGFDCYQIQSMEWVYIHSRHKI